MCSLQRIRRYGQPGPAVTCLVHDLVNDLAQLEGMQRGLIEARIATASLSVALAEGDAVALHPSLCRAPEPAGMWVADQLCTGGGRGR